jgi:hypothetical protein
MTADSEPPSKITLELNATENGKWDCNTDQLGARSDCGGVEDAMGYAL